MRYSFSELQNIVSDMLQEYIGAVPTDLSLDEELYKNREEHRKIISSSIRNCCSGNLGARETIKSLIHSFLTEQLATGWEMMRGVIPFDEPQCMTSWQQLESMIFYFDKQKENQGFRLMCEKFDWNRSGCVITAEKLEQAYVTLKPEMSLEERVAILSQLLFAKTVGLGVIDTLNYQQGCIEEIQIGMSGKAERQYDYKEDLRGKMQDETFSRDGVHLMVDGCTIWMKCISFETEEELQRVLRNLIKESQGGELTKNHPMLVVDAVDGRRISVSRPPMTDSWVGLIRKFDTVRNVSLEALYRGYPEEKILVGLLRQIVRSGRNIAITGEMASGKTTLFRACLSETKRDRNLRVIEVDSFELNVRGFLPNANTMTMRVSERTPAEEVLAFARKTTGQIFAIGEINSAAVAAMAMDLSKIATQLLFSAHYVTTEHMVADFVNAKLCVGGYSEEKLAELDVVRCLGFDIHLRTKQGKRYVQCISEIVPKKQKGGKQEKSYEIKTIYQYDEESGIGRIVNKPGEISYDKAKQVLDKEEYLEFCRFFEREI